MEIPSSFVISCMLHLRGNKEDWYLLHTPIFLDPDTGKEATVARSRRLRTGKVKISLQHLKIHSLRIGVSTAYATSLEGGYMTADFLGL